MKAHEFLEKAANHMIDRATTYDAPGGERSMGRTITMFNALTDADLTTEQGWLFMALLKIVRTQQGKFRADNYEDLAAYAALAGEEAGANPVGLTDDEIAEQAVDYMYPRDQVNHHGRRVHDDERCKFEEALLSIANYEGFNDDAIRMSSVARDVLRWEDRA